MHRSKTHLPVLSCRHCPILRIKRSHISWAVYRGAMRSPGKRAALTAQQVREIFHSRIPPSRLLGSSARFSVSSRSVEVSRRFGVSPKAVRDIWNRRTWSRVTSTMQMISEAEAARHNICFNTVHGSAELRCESHLKKVGRPRGSKDSKPRRRRLNGVSRLGEHSWISVLGSDMRHDLPASDQFRCGSLEYMSFPSFGIDAGNFSNENVFCNLVDHDAESEKDGLNQTYPFFLQL